VVGITDGDTLTARCDPAGEAPMQTIKVRLAEIDAPESHQPFGRRSREHLVHSASSSPPRFGQSQPAASGIATVGPSRT
jgi:endonuclease YncB( thermonuclease family)